jgi:hypothetical protein
MRYQHTTTSCASVGLALRHVVVLGFGRVTKSHTRRPILSVEPRLWTLVWTLIALGDHHGEPRTHGQPVAGASRITRAKRLCGTTQRIREGCWPARQGSRSMSHGRQDLSARMP